MGKCVSPGHMQNKGKSIKKIGGYDGRKIRKTEKGGKSGNAGIIQGRG
jgi:hypothetical protein